MRNLKKILALVLALVMSLSLMAAAGASSFPDVDDGNPYATAIEVLDELKVFQGYKEDGTFRPTETLNRAQAAVLVYRIATGDVEDKYLDNYTFMQQSKFTDLDGYNWAKGYINYCQNAGIVVGTSATTFDPGAKVTGYQLLVMLLRTLGYGKAGEFADPKGWELQTAAIAEREGILKNVTTGDLGAAAPRQMVAEILFQGLLTDTVTYSALVSGGYTKGETLGMREFGLEGYEGVVVANEYANLNGASVLDEGETQVQVKGEDDVRTLNYGSKITDIGERRLIYTQNKAKVLYLADTVDGKELNTVKEYGEGVNISSAANFKKASEMNQVGTEFYVNFDPSGYYTCDQRLEFVVTFTYKAGETYQPNTNLPYTNLNQIIADFQDDYVDGLSLTGPQVGMTKVDDGTDANTATYSKIIRANTEIYPEDLSVIYGIFAAADNNNTSNTRFEGVEGDVFVGTYSNAVVTGGTNDNERDLSNQISFNKFVADYLNPYDNTQNWNTSSNGAWVKFIDNDKDGNCEYAFKTHYELQEVVDSNKNSAGDTILQYNDFDDAGSRFYPVVYMNGDERVECDVEVGDIVLVATIDHQILVSEAESVTTSATSYNYKTDSIVAANGETYGQSGEPDSANNVDNLTDMQDLLANMAPNTEYEMFLDKFGFVRAYRLPGGTKYALVTELYYTNGQYGNLQQNWPMTAELTMPDENGNPVTKEYSVAAGGASQLLAKQPWTLVNSLASTGSYYNWLQPAIAHLGVTRDGYSAVNGTPAWDDPVDYSTYWPANRQLIKNMTATAPAANPMTGLNEFKYGGQDYRQLTSDTWDVTQTASASFTNIAIVNGEDTVTLTGAARLNLDTNGRIVNSVDSDGNAIPVNPSNYAVDYIQLTTDRPEKGASSYKIDDTSAAYARSYNYYVNADKDTEIYVVYSGGVKYFKGYGDMPKLSSDLVGKIHAAYTVARNTTTGEGARNYWIADVIVYEVEKWNDVSANSISLVYFTASQQVQSASSVTLETLNSKTNPAKVSLVPADLTWGTTNNWWGNWGYNSNTGFGFNDYGFYQLYNEAAPAEGETVMSAKAIKKITTDYNKSGIYAGVVAREVDLATAGYIPVNLSGATEADGVTLKIEAQVIITNSNIYSITDEYWSNPTMYGRFFDADNIWYNSTAYSQVKANDRIMWVGAAPSATVPTSASFIVDMGSNAFEGTSAENGLLDNTLLWKATPDWVKAQWTAIDADQKKIPTVDTNSSAKELVKAANALLDNENATPDAITDLLDIIDAWTPKADDATGDVTDLGNKVNDLKDHRYDRAKAIAKQEVKAHAEKAKGLIDPPDSATDAAIDARVATAESAIDGIGKGTYENDLDHAFDTIISGAKSDITGIVEAYVPAEASSEDPQIILTPDHDGKLQDGTIPVDVTIEADIELENGKLSRNITVKEGYTPDWTHNDADGKIKNVVFDPLQTSARAAANGFVTWVMTITFNAEISMAGVTVAIDANALIKLVPENPTEWVRVTVDGASSTTTQVVKGSTLSELPIAIELTEGQVVTNITIAVGEGATQPATYDAENNKLTFDEITATAAITVTVTKEMMDVETAVHPARLFDTTEGSTINNDLYTSYGISTEEDGTIKINAEGVKAQKNVNGREGRWVGLAFVPTAVPEGCTVTGVEMEVLGNGGDANQDKVLDTVTGIGSGEWESGKGTGTHEDTLVAYYFGVPKAATDAACTWKFKIVIDWTVTSEDGTRTYTVTETYPVQLNATVAPESTPAA